MYFRKDLWFCSTRDIILLFRAFGQHILLLYHRIIQKRNIMRISYYSTTTIIISNVHAILMLFFLIVGTYSKFVFINIKCETKFINK